MSIPKFAHAGTVAAGALALALTASAFTNTPAHPAITPRGAGGHATAPHATTRGTHAVTRAHHGARPAVVQPGGPLSGSVGKGNAAAKFSNGLGNLNSRNWGGYAVERKSTKFRYIESTFFVPYVNCADSPNSYSGHWIGLDGLANSTVEQDGILAACNGSSPLYQAWWEMFPKDPVYPNITIRPGNSIEAYVRYGSGKFTLSVDDTTNGQHFKVTEGCPSGSTCPRTSAEVISEAPSNGTSILPLTNFRAESFNDTKIISTGGHTSGLLSRWWDTEGITTVNSAGEVLDQPTAIYAGSSFDMYWMRED